MYHTPEDCRRLRIRLPRRKRVPLVAALIFLLSMVMLLQVSRANAGAIEYEFTFTDREDTELDSLHMTPERRVYEIVLPDSATQMNVPEGLGVDMYYEWSTIPLLRGSNQFTVRDHEASDDPYQLTVYRGVKSPILHSADLGTDTRMLEELSPAAQPTKDGGLIILGPNNGDRAELYKTNEFGEITAKSTLYGTRLHDVSEIGENQYLVIGNRTTEGSGSDQPFAAVYETFPGKGLYGYFEPMYELELGENEEEFVPVSIAHTDSDDEYLVAANRMIDSVPAIALLRIAIDENDQLNIISETDISSADSYFASKIINARDSEHYLIVGQATDRATHMSRGLMAKVGYDDADGTLALVNDFGTEGLMRSNDPDVEYVAAAAVGADRYVVLAAEASPEAGGPSARLLFMKEDGSPAADDKPLPDLLIPYGTAALAGTPDGGFVVGGSTKLESLFPQGEPGPLWMPPVFDPDVNKGYLYKFGPLLEEQWKKTIGSPFGMYDVTGLMPLENGDIWVAGNQFRPFAPTYGYITKLLGPATFNSIEPAGGTYAMLDEADSHHYLDDTYLTWNIYRSSTSVQADVNRMPGQSVSVDGKLLPEGEPLVVSDIDPEGGKQVEIEVTAADQQTQKRYTLNIVRSLSDPATVTRVTYNGTPLVLYEDRNMFYLPVTSSVYQADLELTLSEPDAVFEVMPAEGVTYDSNHIRIASLPYGEQLILSVTVTSSEQTQSFWTIMLGPPSPTAAPVIPSLKPIGNMSFEVTLATATSEAGIYYTLDGTQPSAEVSELYDPLHKPRIMPGWTLKAVAVKQGMQNSLVLVLDLPLPGRPGLTNVNDVLRKINERADVDGGGFGQSDVIYWLGLIQPVRVVPEVPPQS